MREAVLLPADFNKAASAKATSIKLTRCTSAGIAPGALGPFFRDVHVAGARITVVSPRIRCHDKLYRDSRSPAARRGAYPGW